MEKLIIKSLEEEIKLKRELWWVYANILENFAGFDKEIIKKRMDELRFR